MKAVVLREHGGGGLRYETDFPDPVSGAGDVVVRVRVTSLNYYDIFTRRGMLGIKIPMPAIMGLDVAGEIAATGLGVSRWKIADRVLGDPINRVEGGLTGETVHGGLAEYCRLRAHQLVKIPDRVSFAQAATLPCVYGTADDVHPWLGDGGRKSTDPRRLRRCRGVLRPARQARRRHGDCRGRIGGKGRSPAGTRCRRYHQLHGRGFCPRDLHALR